MNRVLVVSNIDRVDEHKEIALKYNVGFEYNDFYVPDIINDDEKVREIIDRYKEAGVPEYCTLHGAFYDVTVFSEDKNIRDISYKKMEQSMEIAKEIGARGVVFHTNVNPYLVSVTYDKRVVEFTVNVLEKLLEKYSDIEIYLENMFDSNPHILAEISKHLTKYNNYGVCFDYAHASIYGNDIDDWIETLRPYVKHIHINDNDLKHDLHLALGDGELDWNKFLDYYNKYFSECSVLIETTLPENQIKSLEFLKKIEANRLESEKLENAGAEPDKSENIEVESEKLESAETVTGKLENAGSQQIELSADNKAKVSKDNKDNKSDVRELAAEELLERIFYYMTKLVEIKEFSGTVDLLTDLGSTIVNSDRASFWFWDTNSKQYWTLSAQGNGRITIPEGTGIVGKAITENRTILCNDTYSQPYFNGNVDKETGYLTRSTLCMPITNVDNEVIGAFQVINKIDENGNAGEFDERDINRLSIAVAFCEKSLESHLLHNVALRDRLTGLKNRYSFYEYYNKKVLPNVNDVKFSFIMCDIDFFKKVNDTYGHNAGDEILRSVSKLFKDSVDKEDEIVRWGGEEFIFILKNKDISDAKAFAEELRSQIEKSDFLVEDKILNVTMSFGVSELNAQNNIEDNIKVVDGRLYKAKRDGRNRVIDGD